VDLLFNMEGMSPSIHMDGSFEIVEVTDNRDTHGKDFWPIFFQFSISIFN